MKTRLHFKGWLLPAVLALLSCGYCGTDQTPPVAEETQAATVADPVVKDESDELLLKFNNLAGEIELLKLRSQEASKLDHMALLEFVDKLQDELYALLDQLVEQQN